MADCYWPPVHGMLLSHMPYAHSTNMLTATQFVQAKRRVLILIGIVLFVDCIWVLFHMWKSEPTLPLPLEESNQDELIDAYPLRELNYSVGACRVPTPSSILQRKLEWMFRHHKSLETCDEREEQLCCVTVRSTGKSLMLHIYCDLAPCYQNRTHHISIGVFSNVTGDISWYNVHGNKAIRSQISSLVQVAMQRQAAFILISCLNNELKRTTAIPVVLYGKDNCEEYKDRKGGHLFHVTVLLNRYKSIFSPLTTKTRVKNKKNTKHVPLPNINIVLIDSVSREHFVRSLKKSHTFLKKLSKSKKMSVFDFRLYHALKARTFENLHCLFTGKVPEFSQSYDGLAIAPHPLGVKVLFSKFKAAGYSTLYQEDLCVKYEWGLARNLGVVKSIREYNMSERLMSFRNALVENSIEDIGPSYLSCEILERHRLTDPFFNSGKLCFNGRFQHEYHLDYILSKLRIQRIHATKPLFTFSVINVGHEQQGLRIQTFDNAFVQFLTALVEETNTINFIMSDHGNTYGKYPTTLQGKLESFHPFLYILFPANIGTPGVALKNLYDNQYKLMSVQDLHYAFLGFINSVLANSQPRLHGGIFERLQDNRNCSHLPLTRSCLCICGGWKVQLQVDSPHFLMAEIVLHSLNKQIVDAQKDLLTSQSQFYCQQLQGISVFNVWQSHFGLQLRVGLDIKVQQNNVFSCQLSIRQDAINSIHVDILEVKRTTVYGIYKTCAHKNVNLQLCVCQLYTGENKNKDTRKAKVNKNKSEHPNDLESTLMLYPGAVLESMFGVKTKITQLAETCLRFLTREYFAGVSIEILNVCWDRVYTISIKFVLDNMKVGKVIPDKTKIHPGAVEAVAVLIATSVHVPWHWEYDLQYQWQPER